MPISFLPAQPEDLHELIPLMKELQADDPWSEPFQEDRVKPVVADLLANPSFGRVWIIADGDTKIGYIVMAFDYSLEYGGRGAWVDEFFVRREYRGHGIGSQALDFFVDQAQDLGATVVYLEVNRGNPALELYRRKGFEDHQRYLMSRRIEGRR
jgi:GNAT superfamily N-acetyltransferase